MMNHFMSVTWAQSILIEIGVLLQVAAIIALIKQRAGYRMLPRDSGRVQNIEDEEMASDNSDQEDPAHEYSEPVNRRPERWSPVTKTGRLTKTSKVTFKQNLKFGQ